MKFTLKTMTGDSDEFEANPEDSILAVKNKLYQKKGIDPVSQILLHFGNRLNDGLTLEQSKVNNGDIINLLLRVKGGI